MAKKKQMGEVLYDLLPQLYKKEDAERTHLKRFLQVNGVGLDFLREKTEGYSNMFDLDRTPSELLPHIAKMMGFDFPYDMTVQEQRSMLKLLPTLYKLKGTNTAFDYLARQLFGLDAKAYSEWVSRGGDNGENQVRINIEANGETTYLQTRIDRYYKYSEQFRPINHKLFWKIMLHYNDEYKRQEKSSIEYMIDRVFINDDFDPNLMPRLNNGLILSENGIVLPRLMGEFYDRANIVGDIFNFDKITSNEGNDNYTVPREEIILDYVTSSYTDIYNENKIIVDNFTEVIRIDDDFPLSADTLNNDLILNVGKMPELRGDVYDKSKIFVSYEKDVLLDNHSEVYNKEVIAEEEIITSIKYTDVDTYSKVKDDTLIDKAISLVNSLNVATLNSTMLLSKNPTITYY